MPFTVYVFPVSPAVHPPPSGLLLMASRSASLDAAVRDLVACWRQYKVHGKRMSKDGIEYDVEMRGNGKRRSEWKRATDTDPHLVRQFNAKRRIERSQQKEVHDMVSERSSQTIFIISDAESDDDEQSVVSLSSSVQSDLSQLIPVHADSPAAACETPRRSSRSRITNEKYKSYFTDRVRLSARESELSDQEKEQRVHVRPLLSSPSPPDDDSFQFLEMIPDQSFGLDVRRLSTRTSEVPDSDAVKSRPRNSRKRTAPDESGDPAVTQTPTVSLRRSTRIQSSKSATTSSQSTATAPPIVIPAVTPSTKSGPAKCTKVQSNGSEARRAFSKQRVTVKHSNAASKSISNKRSEAETCASGTRRKKVSGSSATPVSRKDCTLLPDADELGMIDLIQGENQVAQFTSTTEGPETCATMSSISKPKTARTSPASSTPVRQNVVRTSTTKSGRKSISKIDDGSFVYDVNAILKEDADIQRKTRAEESRLRSKKIAKTPETSLSAFYQSKSQARSSSAAPFTEPYVRKMSESRRKLSVGFHSVLWQDNNIEVQVMKQKAAGSVPIEIKGEKFGNYVVEFSKGSTLGVPVQILEKHFPEQHKNLVVQRAWSRARPATPAYSQPRSPCSSLISPSTPRTPIAFHMDYSAPSSPASKDGSCDVEPNVVRNAVGDRRCSVNSLMSDIEIPDDEEEYPLQLGTHPDQLNDLSHCKSDVARHKAGGECDANGTTNGVSAEVLAEVPFTNGPGNESSNELVAQTACLSQDESDNHKDETESDKEGPNPEEKEDAKAGVTDTEKVVTTSCEGKEQENPQSLASDTSMWDAFVDHLVSKESPGDSDDVHLNGCTDMHDHL